MLKTHPIMMNLSIINIWEENIMNNNVSNETDDEIK